jgi:hypothetical protein
MFEKIKSFLQGKKTYILAAATIVTVWLDYFFGIGLSDTCKSNPPADSATTQAVVESCTISLNTAVSATWAAVMAATVRAGITTEVNKVS